MTVLGFAGDGLEQAAVSNRISKTIAVIGCGVADDRSFRIALWQTMFRYHGTVSICRQARISARRFSRVVSVVRSGGVDAQPADFGRARAQTSIARSDIGTVFSPRQSVGQGDLCRAGSPPEVLLFD